MRTFKPYLHHGKAFKESMSWKKEPTVQTYTLTDVTALLFACYEIESETLRDSLGHPSGRNVDFRAVKILEKIEMHQAIPKGFFRF